MRISKKVEYALISMLHMSKKSEQYLTTAKELSICYNIPPELMGKVLQRLARFNLVESVQGVKGGYRLAKKLDEVNISTLFTAMGDSVKIVSCLKNRDSGDCDQKYKCIIRNPMNVIQRKLEVLFDQVKLSDIDDELIPHSRFNTLSQVGKQ